MKKIALLMSFVLIFSFFGCKSVNSEESLESPYINTSENIESSGSSDINKTKIKELERELTRLNTLLSTTNTEKESLAEIIIDLEKQIEKLKYQIKSKEFYLKEGICLTLYREPALHRLSIKYKDNSVVDIIELYLISEIELSPDGSKVILNDFDQEATARVYLYDVDKRKTQELLIKLPDFMTVSRMKWFDNRYFMFIAQSNAGIFAKGGDVYIYDTQTDNYKMIISRTNSDYQISNMDVYTDSFCVFTSILYEKTFSSYQSFHHIITFDEMYNLIKSSKVLKLEYK